MIHIKEAVLFLLTLSVHKYKYVHTYPYSEGAKVDDAVIAEAEHGEVQLWVGGAEVVSAGDPAAWQHEWP